MLIMGINVSAGLFRLFTKSLSAVAIIYGLGFGVGVG